MSFADFERPKGLELTKTQLYEKFVPTNKLCLILIICHKYDIMKLKVVSRRCKTMKKENSCNLPPILPQSLKNKQIKHILMRVIPCAILLGIFATILILWGKTLLPLREEYMVLRIVLYTVFMCIPLAITGVPFKLIDSAWSGTIAAIDVEESIGVYTSGGGKIWPYPKNSLVLTVNKDNGKTIKYIDISLGIKNSPWNHVPNVGKIEHQTAKYCIGDRVCKVYGFKYLYVFPKENSETNQCIVCGSVNKTQDANCWYCKFDLINIDYIRSSHGME